MPNATETLQERTHTCPVCEGTRELDPCDVTHPDHPDNTGDGAWQGDFSCLACRGEDGVPRGIVTQEDYDSIPEDEHAAVRRALGLYYVATELNPATSAKWPNSATTQKSETPTGCESVGASPPA